MKVSPMSQNFPLVSIVIPTRNEAVNIISCLEAIGKQNYSQDKLEVIIVDNNSTDQTKILAASYTNKIFNYGPERSAQRNFGVNKASGKYILYLDADMILSEKVVSECVEECEGKELVSLYIKEIIIGEGFWIKVRDFERKFYVKTCIDCVRFIRRDKFIEIGGFDENLTGPEDWDFDRRIRTRGEVGLIKAAIYHNERKLKFFDYVHKKNYYAEDFGKYIKKWGKNDHLVRKQFGFFYRYFGIFMGDKKYFELLAHPILTIAMYYLRILVGLAYIYSKFKNIYRNK